MRSGPGTGHESSGHGRRLGHRYGYAAPRHYRKSIRSVPRADDGSVRYYNSPRAYRSACAYGDCVCLRNIAVATGNPVWWDKYQACAG